MSSWIQTDNFHDLQTSRLMNQTKPTADLKTLISQTQPVNNLIQAEKKTNSDKTARPRSRSRSSSPRRSSPRRGSSSTKKRDHKRRGEGKWAWNPAQLINLTLGCGDFFLPFSDLFGHPSPIVCYSYEHIKTIKSSLCDREDLAQILHWVWNPNSMQTKVPSTVLLVLFKYVFEFVLLFEYSSCVTLMLK